MGMQKPQCFCTKCAAFKILMREKFFGFFSRIEAGGRQTQPASAERVRHTVLILLIVPTAFSERGVFSRPDAIFGLFFEVYELPDFPERITSYSGTNYQLFRNELPVIPTVYLTKCLLKRV